jgi:transcriptional regulator with XRE-family HTH domain
MEISSRPTASNDTFAACLKQARIRIRAKQCWLAREIGCTDAAISHWENGARLPRQRTMRRIFQALERSGAPPTELVSLLVAWRNCLDKRNLGARAA